MAAQPTCTDRAEAVVFCIVIGIAVILGTVFVGAIVFACASAVVSDVQCTWHPETARCLLLEQQESAK